MEDEGEEIRKRAEKYALELYYLLQEILSDEVVSMDADERGQELLKKIGGA